MSEQKVDIGGKLSVRLPGQWEDRTVYTFLDAESAKTPISLTMRIEKTDYRTTLMQYVDLQFTELARDLPGFKLIHRKEVEPISKKPAMELMYTWSAQGKTYRQFQTFIQSNDNEFISVVCSAPQESFPSSENILRKIIQTIEFPLN